MVAMRKCPFAIVTATAVLAGALAPGQAAYAAAATHEVTVRVTDRLGEPVSATEETPQTVVFADLANRGRSFHAEPVNGVVRVSIPAGRYGVVTQISTPKPEDPAVSESVTFAAVARLVLDRDRSLAFDARQGKPLAFRVDRPDAVLQALSVNLLVGGWYNHLLGFRTEHNPPVYLVPAPASNPRDLTLGVLGVLAPAGHAAKTDTYQYSLAHTSTGIPADPRVRYRDGQLATVRAHYGAGGRETRGEAGFEARYLPGQDPQGWWLETPLPASRTHLLTPGRWTGGMFERPATETNPGEIAQYVVGTERGYRAGRAPEERWNQAVFSPALRTPVSDGVTRRGNTIAVAVDMLAPGAAGYGSQVPFSSDVLAGDTTLARNGDVVGRSDQPGWGTFAVPSSSDTYTLTVRSKRLNPASPLARQTEARWTFTSAGTDGNGPAVALPLLTVRPSGGFDKLNQAPANTTFPLTLDVGHQKGSAASTVTRVGLDVSFDDGRTWQRTDVVCGGGTTWTANVVHPPRGATSGFVALRASAADAAGGSVEVTLRHAYKLAAD